MVAQIGEEQARELVPYEQYGERFPITQEAASRIIEIFHPNATLKAKLEMTILCTQYNLNPLPTRKEVFIVTFNEGKPNQEDAVVIGIAGHRVLARRKSPFTYLGDRPLGDEEVKARGEEPGERIWAEATIKLPGGDLIRGVGNYGKDAKLIGADKGNTRYDMAAKRAEAKALARIVPPEDLPAPVGMVIEGVYADVTDLPASDFARPASRAASAPARSVPKPAGNGGDTSGSRYGGLSDEEGKAVSKLFKQSGLRREQLAELVTAIGAESIGVMTAEQLTELKDLLGLVAQCGLTPDQFGIMAAEAGATTIGAMAPDQAQRLKHQLADMAIFAESKAQEEKGSGSEGKQATLPIAR